MRVSQTGVITATIVINATDCCTCGVVYGITEEYERERRRDGQWFYCPNGHKQHYGEGEADQLRAQLESEKKTAAEMNRERERLQRELVAREKKIKLMQRRAVAGTCQFCKRSFANVERHMHTKHTDEVEQAQLH